MGKEEFLAQLRKGLAGLPREDIEERLTFYSEMIDDRMEEGLSEEEAVSAIGSAQDIAAQAVAETPLVKIAKERLKVKRRPDAGVILLLALGSPIWLSLGIAAFAVVFSLYIALWSVILSLWAVFASLAACSIGGLLAFIIFTAGGKAASGAVLLAAGLVCAGLSILLFYGCKATVKGILLLTKKAAAGFKHRVIRKEEAL